MSDHTKGKDEGGYVFISHAHKDIHDIRRIRNFLEENGLEPICFYLRCLSDDDEVLDLIKREIDAREWFLLVDSKNARQSNWVKTEVDYIKSKDSKKMVSVSLDKQDDIIPTLTRLSKSMRVFLSSSHADHYIAQAIYNECLKHDFKTFCGPESIKVGEDFAEAIRNAITEASKHGCVVLILSENSIHSLHVRSEMMRAESEGAHILAVIIDDVDLPPEFRYCLAGHQSYRLKSPVSDDQITEIVGLLEAISLKILEGG